MKKKYGDKDGVIKADAFTRFPSLFATLDANSNGTLEDSEVSNLEKVEPHIRLQTNVGMRTNKNPVGIKIESVTDELGNNDAIAGKMSNVVSMTLSDVTIRFVSADSPARRFNYGQTSQRMVDQYDTDKNGFIEEKEMAKVNPGLKQQFQRWDMDSDGKVYAKEITAWYHRQQAPSLSRVTTQVGEQGPMLFSTLDLTGDNRLSLREMKTAAEQLKKKDTNGDGEIGLDEIPTQIHVSFGQGNGYSAGIIFTNTSRTTAKPNQKEGPDWFTRMDRNGDGDVTLREFLGSEEQFKKFDTNNDGFIELAEAKAAEIASGDTTESKLEN
jgi:Ca2+-binding EF-hand superfamily protein